MEIKVFRHKTICCWGGEGRGGERGGKQGRGEKLLQNFCLMITDANLTWQSHRFPPSPTPKKTVIFSYLSYQRLKVGVFCSQGNERCPLDPPILRCWGFSARLAAWGTGGSTSVEHTWITRHCYELSGVVKKKKKRLMIRKMPLISLNPVQFERPTALFILQQYYRLVLDYKKSSYKCPGMYKFCKFIFSSSLPAG